jgi:hypothetical protein
MMSPAKGAPVDDAEAAAGCEHIAVCAAHATLVVWHAHHDVALVMVVLLNATFSLQRHEVIPVQLKPQIPIPKKIWILADFFFPSICSRLLLSCHVHIQVSTLYKREVIGLNIRTKLNGLDEKKESEILSLYYY